MSEKSTTILNILPIFNLKEFKQAFEFKFLGRYLKPNLSSTK
jgi:hypothetical protein